MTGEFIVFHKMVLEVRQLHDSPPAFWTLKMFFLVVEKCGEEAKRRKFWMILHAFVLLDDISLLSQESVHMLNLFQLRRCHDHFRYRRFAFFIVGAVIEGVPDRFIRSR